jgi:hypothetical protein
MIFFYLKNNRFLKGQVNSLRQEGGESFSEERILFKTLENLAKRSQGKSGRLGSRRKRDI